MPTPGARYDGDVLLFDAPLTFGEFMSHEDVPLAAVFREVLTFLQEREDVLFGAQAVNAYCEPPRMTEDLDVMARDPIAIAEAIRTRLAARFHIAARIRKVADGRGMWVYQLRKPRNRHLVDVRAAEHLPPCRVIERVQVIAPDALAAMKADAIAGRGDREKGLSDRLDLARLLRTFPDLRDEQRIHELAARFDLAPAAAAAWRESAARPLAPEPEDDIEDESDD